MIERIFLIHHTHMDIGYTDLAHEVLDQHLGHMDRVLNLCDRNEALPEHSQFRWTCESALIVQDYLACRGEPQRQRLFTALRNGWIELQAFLTQPLTELATADELIDCVSYAVELGQSESFPVECVMLDDIGGYAGRLPTILQRAGIRYLVAGSGGFWVHLPWAQLPHLFYLESKDGARVLIWNLGIDRSKTPREMSELDAVYGIGGAYLVRPQLQHLMNERARATEADIADNDTNDNADPAEVFARLTARLERENYPYPEIMLQYGADNGGPNDRLVELLDHLNGAGELPPITLTTPMHFFRSMEEKYESAIPVIRGVMADPWNMRANPQPSALKTFRRAQRTLTAARARLALADVDADAADEQDTLAAMQNLQLYTDHTYGLSEWGWQQNFTDETGTRDRAFDRYRASWQTKHLYAQTALRLADGLDRRIRQRIASRIRSEQPLIVVWNDTTASRTGPAEVYLGRDALALRAVHDMDTGENLAFQCIGANQYMIAMPAVPAMGCRAVAVAFAAAGEASPTPPEGAVDVIENAYLRVAVSAAGKITSVTGKATGREFVDRLSDHGLGDFLFHVVKGIPVVPEKAGMARDIGQEPLPTHLDRVAAGLTGPMAWSVVVHEHVDGPAGIIRIRRELVLYQHAPRLECRIRVDKPENAGKESCYVAFPLAGRDGVFRFDQHTGWVEPASDLIPGAMQDAFYSSSWINVCEDDAHVTVVCPDAPVFQLGRIRTLCWDDEFPFNADSNHVYSWLYQNILNTDNPIWQDVLDEFRFSLEFHDDTVFTEGGVMAAAAAVTHPLHGDFFAIGSGTGDSHDVGGTLQVTPESVRVHGIRKSASGAVRILLEETTGVAVTGSIVFDRPVRTARAETSDRDQVEVGISRDGTVALTLAPFALAAVLVD